MQAKRSTYSSRAGGRRHSVATRLVVSARATIKKDTPMCAYNLFHHKDERHLICAVPADRTAPDFIAGTAWEFNRTLPDAGPAPIGFDAMAAIHAVRFNGFYLFQSFNE
jgi:hypothetical protein